MPSIVLLKLRSSGRDPYVEAFRAAGWDVEVVSPIEVSPLPQGQAELTRAVAHPASWGGIALTSPRAAAAAAQAGDAWAGPIWAVGEATAAWARRLGPDVRGAEAGTARALADRIVADAPAGTVLFPCGQRRREALPARLAAAGIPVREIRVYTTALRPGPLLGGSPQPGADVAVAFFSPSGVEAALADPSFPWAARLAAIGPTTAAALRDAGAAPAVAATPTPAALLAALA